MREFHVNNEPVQKTDCNINLQDCPVLHFVSNKQLNCTLYGEEIIEFWKSNNLSSTEIINTVREICRKKCFYADRTQTR